MKSRGCSTYACYHFFLNMKEIIQDENACLTQNHKKIIVLTSICHLIVKAVNNQNLNEYF